MILLQKAQNKYGNGDKEKATKYYQGNKDAIKEKANSKYNNLTKKKRKKQKKNIARVGIKNERKCNRKYFIIYKVYFKYL